MQGPNKIVEKLFRSEYGKIIAVLLNRFGPSQLEKIEDSVQDALLKAMQIWGYTTLPDNPTSWLLQVARNNLIDNIRREQKMAGNFDALKEGASTRQETLFLENTISDSQLKMIFACCHPSLSMDYQLVLSLKLIGGFGNKEIAKALLKKEDTVAKSFTRAKQQLKNTIRTLDIPLEMGLQSRLAIVLKVIYLLFSEGYAPSSGTVIIKKDICMEAIRLALLLGKNNYCDHPNVHALIALMCFHVSRFDARVDANKALVDLEHQDRKKYNKTLIDLGMQHLERASWIAQSPSGYHLQAAVSYHHCTAPTFEETDWKSILHLYELQLKRQYSPVVQLNSLVPYYMVYGPEKAWTELQHFEKSPYFLNNALFHAIKAEILTRLKDIKNARMALENAISMTTNTLEKAHLNKKLIHLNQGEAQRTGSKGI